MKNLVIICVLIAGKSFSQISSDNLIFHAPFDNTIQDVSGNNVSMLNNGCTYTADRLGASFNALYFNGSNSITLNGNQPIITSSNFSVGGWAKMNGNGGGIDSQSTMFQQRGDDATLSAKSTIVLFTKTLSNNAVFFVRSSVNNNASSVSVSSPSPSLNTWHHYFGVKCTDSIHFYIDGQKVGSSPYNQTGDFVTSINYVSIGKHTHTSDQLYGSFNGDIDEFRIYDVCLSDKDVRDIYNDNFLSINEIENQTYFNIFPNPTNGKFTISLLEASQIKRIDLMDISGRLIKTKDVNPTDLKLDFELSDRRGVYLVCAFDANNNKLSQKKLVIE